MNSTTSSRGALSSTSSSICSTSSVDVASSLNKQMYAAVLQKNDAALRAAIMDGADVDHRHENYGPGNTALIGASFNGWVEGVSILIDQGANVDEVNSYGENALLCCASHGTKDVAQVLLLSDCVLSIQANNGETAQERAEQNNFTEIVEMIDGCVKRRMDKVASDHKSAEEARLYRERLTDIELFLKKLDVYERVWPTLQQEAIMDMKTLGQLSQQDFRSIGILLGDIVRIGRGLAEREAI